MSVDALDRLSFVGADLLNQVDARLLRYGAPAGHPVLDALRRAGALPGELVAALAEVTPAALRGAAEELRRLADGYAEQRAHVEASAAVAGAWQGTGAEAFGAQWAGLAAHLAGPDEGETLAGRLARTAGYLDAVAQWVAEARLALAGVLAAAMTSAQAVTLRATPEGDSAGTRAAADIAEHILTAVVACADDAERMRSEWAVRLGELPYRATAGMPARVGGTISLPL